MNNLVAGSGENLRESIQALRGCQPEKHGPGAGKRFTAPCSFETSERKVQGAPMFVHCYRRNLSP